MMGQILRRLQEAETSYWEELVVPQSCAYEANKGGREQTQFPDLAQLPPELGLSVLSYLNATDLCLAACIWDGLANDEVLWMRQCLSSWRRVSVYRECRHIPTFSYRKLYMMLDEASVTFNGDPDRGISYLHQRNLVKNDPVEIAQFLHNTQRLKPLKKREFLNRRFELRTESMSKLFGFVGEPVGQSCRILSRLPQSIVRGKKSGAFCYPGVLRAKGEQEADLRDVLEKLVQLQNYENIFLPNALRQFFKQISAPTERGSYLEDMVNHFSQRFCKCNPHLGLHKDTVYVLCYSLIMLSVDLCSPHVKNKMSKREFIRNTRGAAQGVNDDLAGHLYDNIYLIGHVAVD